MKQVYGILPNEDDMKYKIGSTILTKSRIICQCPPNKGFGYVLPLSKGYIQDICDYNFLFTPLFRM
jgi:hypothetical protein